MEREKEGNIYKAKISLSTGGDYGYTFRVMPKHQMILESQNLNLVKWITEEMQKDEAKIENEKTETKTEFTEAEELEDITEDKEERVLKEI